MSYTPIPQIQGPGLSSPLAGQRVRTRGAVTGSTRKGFFIQDPDAKHEDASCGLFVFTRRDQPPLGAMVEVEGEVLDYLAVEHDRPTTQLVARHTEVLREERSKITPVWLDAKFFDCDPPELARRLNRLEGMLVGVEKGATFVAPSNPYGDYVVLPPKLDLPRTPDGGVLVDPEWPQRWLPGFRVTDYARAPHLNVGARLRKPVVGPLNYRAQAYQIAVPRSRDFGLHFDDREVDPRAGHLRSTKSAITVMTLNGFNLDPRVERAAYVKDPGRDIDDDVGDGRYHMLAHDVVHRAHAPDLIALQEIQDDDGAEITDTVEATRNYRTLTQAIARVGGPDYLAAEVAPEAGADGGQPGGNIRNGFLYDPERLELVGGTLRRIGDGDPAFDESRKPLLGRFRHVLTGATLTVLNLHLASKRHQYPVFAPEQPGFDPREEQRLNQARRIREELDALDRAGEEWYVTGDFNDYEFSATLRTLTGEDGLNLVDLLPADQRYDYNHRGTSQALLHAVVPRGLAESGRARYEILHGNELIGVTPGDTGGRPTDHAYGMMRLELGER